MKTLFRRSLTTLMCIGTLIAGTQSWAVDAKQGATVVSETKADSKMSEKCQKPCNMKNDEKTQQGHSQHEHGNMADMSQIDHSKMMNMDQSQMGDMDHSKMNMSNTPSK